MKKILLFATLTLALNQVFAHEGHDKTPGALSAPHGGSVKGTDSFYLEVVTNKNEVKIFVFDHAMKAVPVSKIKIDGKMTIPRKNKTETVKFGPKTDYFSATVDAKGAHRYELEVSISHSGKVEKQNFNVEPQ